MRNPIPKFLITFTISWYGFSSQPNLVNPNHQEFWANAIAGSAKKNINTRMFEFERMIDLVDMTNSEGGLLIAHDFLGNKFSNSESDMIEGAWLSYAFNKSPQMSKNKTVFQSEYDAIMAFLQSIDQYIAKYKIYPKNKSIIQLSIWRKNNDLKLAILLLLYKPDFENELNDLLKNNPNVVSDFFAKYGLLPNSKRAVMRPAGGSRLLNGKMISTITIRIQKMHDNLSNNDNKFDKIVTKFNIIHDFSIDKGVNAPESVEIWTIKTRKNLLYSYLVRVLDPLSDKPLVVVSDIDGLPISAVP